MLQKHQDFSLELRESRQWRIGDLRRLHFPEDLTAFAYDPVASLLAIGTAKGYVHIHGKPAVHTLLALESGAPVKFLAISISTSRLVCMDGNNQLSVWDLSAFGRPRLLASARFDQTNCVIASPSHAHVFIAIHSGEIKTYDLLCLRKSPYILPNLWDIYKKKVGWRSKGDEGSIRTSVEVVAHPRDLNLLFVAYAGGVALSDLSQRNVIRAYEYTIPPGAPGGSGFGSPDVLMLRQPSVTCITIHPSGHILAVGYTDGSVAFWAVEDEDQPLLVKTLDTDDVNVVNAQKLEELLSNPGQPRVENCREPVFKMSWSGFSNSSDPRGGKTVLTILGGLAATEPPGLTVFELPACTPTDPPPAVSPDVSQSLHPHFRDAMRESLVSLRTYFYSAQDTVQDYLLISRDNPHYSGTFDPVAIIIMTGPDPTARCLNAFEFPPPAFKDSEHDEHHNEGSATTVDPDKLASELEATLRSLMESSEPRRLKIPFPFWISATGLINGHLFTVDRSSYQALTANSVQGASRLNIGGGNAWADASKENDLSFARYQPRRIMASYNHDGTVQIFDISAQLLSVQITENLRPMALEHEFPNSVPALTIDINDIYNDPHLASLLTLDTEKMPGITLLEFSPQCACVIAMDTGDVIVFRMRAFAVINPRHNEDDSILIPLGYMKSSHQRQLEPHIMIHRVSGRVEASAIADIGLLAISYSNGTFVVIDLKFSRVVLRKDQQKRRSRIYLTSDNAPDLVVDFVWTACSIGKDPQARIRLLAIHLSGHLEIISFMQDMETEPWDVVDDTVSAEAVANPLQHGSFVLDEKTGSIISTDRERMFLMQRASSSETRSIFVTTGSKGARVYAEVTGQRIAKTDWTSSKTGNIQSTQIVEKMGSCALVAFTDKHLALVYSLPHLDHLHTLELPSIPTLPPSIDRSGDFIAFSPSPMSGKIDEAIYGTLFDFRRVYSWPDVELIPSPLTIPPQPQPVPIGPSSRLSAWFRFGLSMSGDQLDTLLGGPERPLPEPEPTKAGVGESPAASIASRAAAVQNDLYVKLTSALSQRGQVAEDLGARFNALEEGSRNMVAQAKKIAAQQITYLPDG
ncbi:hypothetical protein APHAL10511_005887 [Amanita phalloides]|nr:hypothetical protein APHAL10511_005887 [Amanita phalloides]